MTRTYQISLLAPFVLLLGSFTWPAAGFGQATCDPQTAVCVEFSSSDNDDPRYFPTATAVPGPVALTPSCGTAPCDLTSAVADSGSSVTVNPDGTISYVRPYDFNATTSTYSYRSGPDTVRYTLSDGTTGEILVFVCAAEPCSFANPAVNPPTAGTYTIEPDPNDPDSRTFVYTPNLTQLGVSATLSYQVTDSTNATTVVQTQITNPGFEQNANVVSVSNGDDLGASFNTTRTGSPNDNTARWGSAWFSGDDGRSGGAAPGINVVNTGDITPATGQPGIVVRSVGGNGGGGENGGTRTFILIRFYGAGGNGGWGGTGGNVELINSGDVTTANAPGILVESVGGEGGDGGDGSGFVASGGSGGAGGRAGNVRVQNFGDVTTSGASADAIRASSLTGTGGNGGNSSGVFSDGGTAGFGVHSGTVYVESRGDLTTDGDSSRGIYARTIGGGGGNGGAGYGLVGGGADGGGAGNAGAITVITENDIATDGFTSEGIYAYSLGGGGGTGGTGGGWFAVGGDGAAAGDGGDVSVTTEGGSITTLGDQSVGILARSQGGGGGDGGGAVSVGAWVSIAIGGNGGDGGVGNAVLVDNAAAITTQGESSSAIYADSLGGGGGSGGFAFSASAGLGGSFALGVGGSGAGGGASDNVDVLNSGTINTSGTESHGVLARSQGGGGGDGGFSIAGSISDGAAVSFSIGGAGGSGGNSGSVTVDNTGAITTNASDSHGIYAKSNGGGGGDGGFSVSATVSGSASISGGIGGFGDVGGDADIVTVDNAGAITTNAANSHAVYAKSEGGGGGDGGFSFTGGFSAGAGISFGVGGFGGGGGDGKAVTVENDGALVAVGEDSMGILAKSLGGGGGDGGFSISTAAGVSGALNFSIGGFADDGGDAGLTTVLNRGTITTSGTDGTGILASSLGGGGGKGGFSVGGNLSSSGGLNFSLGGGGGKGGHAGEVHVDNFGELIETAGLGAHGISATSRGGGGGDGGFSVAGSLSTSGPAFGISIGGFGDSGGDGKLVKVVSEGDIVTAGAGSHGILAESLGGGGGDGGFSVAGGLSSSGGLNLSVGGFGAGGGIGGNVEVSNSGAITTTGNESSALRAQSTGGGGGDGGFSVAGSVAFRAGGTNINGSVGGGGGPGTGGGSVLVNNQGELTTGGDSSPGLFARSIGGGGGDGGFSVAGALSFGAVKQANTNIGVSVGGGGGDGGLGGIVGVGTQDRRLAGSITTAGDDSQGIFAQSTGGGGGNGGMSYVINIDGDVKPSEKDISFAGSIAVGGGGGSGNVGGAVNVRTQAEVTTTGDRSDAIFAQSIGGGGGLGGGARTLTLSPSSFVPIESLWEGNNYSFNLAVGGGGGDANLGGNVLVENDGALATSGAQARGIFAQSVGGGGGIGGGGILAGPCDVVQDVSDAECPWYVSGLLEVLDAVSVAQKFKTAFVDVSDWSFAVGGSGGDNGDAGTVTVDNTGAIETTGLEAHGIFAQSVGGGGGLAQQYVKAINCAEGVEECSGAGGEASIGLSGKLGIGGAGGAGGDGGSLRVTNSGHLETSGVGAYGIWAQSVGGGGGAAGSVAKGFSNFACEGEGENEEGLCLKANVGVNIAYSRPGGGRGHGGDVTVSGDGDIVTSGLGSMGIFAQSVGGGGGLAGDDGIGFADDVIDALRGMFVGSVGGEGHGGAVSVTQRANITTSGDNAHGIFAQSSGGTDTVNAGGTVSVTVAGNVIATGTGSDGIVAQSYGLGRASDVSVSIEQGIIQGGLGDASGVRILDGANNVLDNRGTIQTARGLAGTAIRASGGNESVTNRGTVVGSMDLGSGTNALTNEAAGRIDSGALLSLGAGNALTNSGVLSVAGSEAIGTTLLRGNLVQSDTGLLEFDVDMGSVSADRLDVAGQAVLGGRVTVSLAAPAVARIQEFTLVSAADPASSSDVTFDALDLPPVMQAEMLGAGTSSLGIRLRPDFTLNGAALSNNRSAVARHLNAVVPAGPDQTMQRLLDSIAVLPTAQSVEAALQRLQPEPLLTVTPATLLSVLRFNSVLHSCRVREDEYRFAAEGECSWSSLSGRWFDQDSAENRVGFERTSTELTLGAQREIAAGLHAGFGFSYENSSLDVESLAELDGDQFELGAVLKKRIRATTLAGSFSVGYGRYDTLRYVGMPDEIVIARADQDLSSVMAGLRIAHDFGNAGWYLRPQADVSATYVRLSSLRESNGYASDLSIGSHSETYVTVQPALEFGGEIESPDGLLARPFVRIGVTRLLSSADVSAATLFEGTPEGVAPFAATHEFEDSYIDGGLGLDLLWRSGASVRIGYFGQYADGTNDHTATVKVRVPF